MAKGKYIPVDEKDLKEVRAMAGLGMRYEDIAAIKGWSVSSLKRKCKDVLSNGRSFGKRTIQNTAFEMARSGKHPALTIFWLKTQCGWSEKEKEGNIPPDPSKKLTTGTIDPVEATKVYQQIMSET